MNPHSLQYCIELRELSIRRGSQYLVRSVSCSVPKGRITGMVGESGSGKSLTCQAIMGILPPSLVASGRLDIGGRSFPLALKKTGAARQTRTNQVAMIMQTPASCFNPVCTIATHFKETLAAYGFAGAHAGRALWLTALAEVGFPEPEQILELYPFQMSGGMLQRTMIALALIQKPDFLLADEATTDLDVVSQARVLDLLGKLAGSLGIGVLLVTHDLSVIARLADTVVVMRDGMVIEQGTVRGIFHSPQQPYTVSLLRAHRRFYDTADAV